MNTQKLKQLVNADIKDSSKLVYVKLSLTGDTKFCHSNKDFSQFLGITKMTVISALDELEQSGWITRETHYRAGGNSIMGRTVTLK
jgi:DNA-binding MarR family transcriptional regulator